MAYVEGFVLAVPRDKKDAYRAMAAKTWQVFKEFGAVRQVECWSDDVPNGQVTDFRRAVQGRADDDVVFSWVEYPSKEVRDAANQKLMEDPRMEDIVREPPFDGKRMILGGFAPILDERT